MYKSSDWSQNNNNNNTVQMKAGLMDETKSCFIILLFEMAMISINEEDEWI